MSEEVEFIPVTSRHHYRNKRQQQRRKQNSVQNVVVPTTTTTKPVQESKVNDNPKKWTMGTIVDWRHYQGCWVRAKIIAVDQQRNIKVQVIDPASCACESPWMRSEDTNYVQPEGKYSSLSQSDTVQDMNRTRYYDEVSCPAELSRRLLWSVGTRLQRISGDKWVDCVLVERTNGGVNLKVRGGIDNTTLDGREYKATWDLNSIHLRASRSIPAVPVAPSQLSVDVNRYKHDEEDFEYLAMDENRLKSIQCSICHEIFRNPYLHMDCGNMFCHACITTHSPQLDRNCPLCRASLRHTTGPAPLMIKEWLQELKVRCKHCALETISGEIKPHFENECLRKCKFNCEAADAAALCGIRGLKALQLHETKQCALALIPCAGMNKGCAFVGRLEQHNAHQSQCVFLKYEELKTSLSASADALKHKLQQLEQQYQAQVQATKTSHEAAQQTVVNEMKACAARIQAVPRQLRNQTFVFVGAAIEVRDCVDHWLRAKVISITNGVVLISYDDYDASNNESFPFDSNALAPYNTHCYGNRYTQRSYYQGELYTQCKCGNAPDCFGSKPR